MIIGLPKEIETEECRVGLTPQSGAASRTASTRPRARRIGRWTGAARTTSIPVRVS